MHRKFASLVGALRPTVPAPDPAALAAAYHPRLQRNLLENIVPFWLSGPSTAATAATSSTTMPPAGPCPGPPRGW